MAKNKKAPNPKKFNEIRKLKEYLSWLRWRKYTYDQIAEAYQVNKGIIWKIINVWDYNPEKFENRLALGLAVPVLVQSVNGMIEPGSIALGSKQCQKCERHYIPNSGKRDQCYICLPMRDRKAEALRQQHGK